MKSLYQHLLCNLLFMTLLSFSIIPSIHATDAKGFSGGMCKKLNASEPAIVRDANFVRMHDNRPASTNSDYGYADTWVVCPILRDNLSYPYSLYSLRVQFRKSDAVNSNAPSRECWFDVRDDSGTFGSYSSSREIPAQGGQNVMIQFDSLPSRHYSGTYNLTCLLRRDYWPEVDGSHTFYSSFLYDYIWEEN